MSGAKLMYENLTLSFTNIDDSTSSGTKSWSSAKITQELAKKQDTLTFDGTPSSTNKVQTTSSLNSALASFKIHNDYYSNQTDLNNIKGSSDIVSVYAIYGNTDYHCPASQNGYLVVFNSSMRDRQTQVYLSNEANYIWIRVCNLGTWSDWKILG